MITTQQAKDFKIWFNNFVVSGGAKAIQNLTAQDLKIPFPQATADELKKVYDLIISQVKKYSLNKVVTPDIIAQLPITSGNSITEISKVVTVGYDTPSFDDVLNTGLVGLLVFSGLVYFLFKNTK